jgi:cell division protein FtsN
VATRDYKTPRPSAPARSGSPMLVGIVIGILVGLAAALGVALYLFKVPAPFMPREAGGKAVPESVSKPAQPPAEQPAREASPAKTGPAAPKSGTAAGTPGTGGSSGTSGNSGNSGPDAKGEKSRFDFYEILPGTQDAAKGRESRPAADGKAAEPKAAPTPSTPAPASAASGSDVYYLQAGAFQSAADAENLKARLALAGIEAKVLTADLPEGKVWHRVRVGPLRGVDEVGRVRERLKQNQIDATLIKQKATAD